MRDKVTAIVLAAGKGSRMHSKIQKQYMEMLGRPVITYALDAFEKSAVDEVILVVAPGETEYARKNIVEKYGFHKVSAIVTGGQERYISVYRALLAIEENKGGKTVESEAKKARSFLEDDFLPVSGGEPEHYVLIHDGARAFLTPELIAHCISQVREFKSCVMGMPVKDTIKIVDEDCYAVSTPNRAAMWQIQTPQCFLTAEIREAYRKMFESGDASCVTDDGMVMETYGTRRVRMIEGSYENIKITTPEDMVLGEAILRHREQQEECR